MRIKLKLKTNNLLLPLSYRRAIQGIIYANLDKDLASDIHDEEDFKFFTYSKLLGKYTILPANQINFDGTVYLLIASVNPVFLENLYNHFAARGYLEFYSQRVQIEEMEVYGNDINTRTITYRTLSPVTIYQTNQYSQTIFYSPFKSEYEGLLLKNLNHKLDQMGLVEDYDFKIRNFKNIKRGVYSYKESSYEAYDYTVTIEASELLHNLIMDTGLGSKNSIGFGMVELA